MNRLEQFYDYTDEDFDETTRRAHRIVELLGEQLESAPSPTVRLLLPFAVVTRIAEGVLGAIAEGPDPEWNVPPLDAEEYEGLVALLHQAIDDATRRVNAPRE